jgi:hypothetical protein
VARPGHAKPSSHNQRADNPWSVKATEGAGEQTMDSYAFTFLAEPDAYAVICRVGDLRQPYAANDTHTLTILIYPFPTAVIT